MKSIVKRYKLPERYDESFFKINEAKGKLRWRGLICLAVYHNYLGAYHNYFSGESRESRSSYFHHDSGASLLVDEKHEQIYPSGSESSINKAVKYLEFLTGKLGKAKIVKSIECS